MTETVLTGTDTDTGSAGRATALDDGRTEQHPRFPLARATGCPFDPPPELAGLREREPFSRVRIWDGTPAWLITRYQDQRTILADDRFSANASRPGFPTQSPGIAARRTSGNPLPFITMDDPDHNRVRRMFTSYFSVKRARALVPRLTEIIDGLLDDMERTGGPVDLVSAFALPLPSLVIAEILGVPREDQHLFQSRSRVLISMKATAEETMAAMEELGAYLGDLIDAKVADPQEDLLSQVAVDHMLTGGTTRSRLIQDAMLLLIAGPRDHRQHDRARHAGAAPQPGAAARGPRRGGPRGRRGRGRGTAALPHHRPHRPAAHRHRGRRDRRAARSARARA